MTDSTKTKRATIPEATQVHPTPPMTPNARRKGTPRTRFQTLDVAMTLCLGLREVLPALRKRDIALADQVRRAGTSVPLNVAEGNRRVGKDRLHLFRVAAGSASELRVALLTAVAWGYVDPDPIERLLALCDRVCAMLWRLSEAPSSALRTAGPNETTERIRQG